jgi:hypothetical protein
LNRKKKKKLIIQSKLRVAIGKVIIILGFICFIGRQALLILVSWIYVLINSEAPAPGIYFFLGFVLITCILSNFRNSFCVTLVSLLKKVVSPLKKEKKNFFIGPGFNY